MKVIRLLARDTVEEIMYSRAVSKLHLTRTVIEEGRFSLLDQAQSAAAGLQVGERSLKNTGTTILILTLSHPEPFCRPQLSEILKFGVDKLLSSEESSVQDVKLEKILGRSRNGRWVDDDSVASFREEAGVEESDLDSEAQSAFNPTFHSAMNDHHCKTCLPSLVQLHEFTRHPAVCPSGHIYYFEGRDYSKDPSSDDHRYFERLLEEQQEELQSAVTDGRALRHKGGVKVSVGLIRADV